MHKITSSLLSASCASPDSEEILLASVERDYKVSFIDKTEKTVIEPSCVDAEGFKEGLAKIMIRPGDKYLHGYIDKTGKTVIEPQFDDAQGFQEGVATVEVNGIWGYINKDGSLAVRVS